jgi:hypothetical protein
VENDLRKIFFIALLTLSSLLGGCGMTEKLEQQSSEIDRLNALLSEQYGTRAAELAFAESQVGIYRGCTFLFNVCSHGTIDVGEKLMRQGFTGYSSAWWWAAFIGKLTAIAGFLGVLFWAPWHLFVTFTRPAKSEIDAAKKLISGLNEKVNDANRKRTQTQQETSALRRELKNMSLAITEQRKVLSETTEAVASAHATLATAKSEVAEISRLRESFKGF